MPLPCRCPPAESASTPALFGERMPAPFVLKTLCVVELGSTGTMSRGERVLWNKERRGGKPLPEGVGAPGQPGGTVDSGASGLSTATIDGLSVWDGPDVPEFAQVVVAAGGAWGRHEDAILCAGAYCVVAS
ncbi:uncharacterized protein BXZ73DRAFT_101358 [Epithele typhae]|uniref:uncharacterized protein n=1 Tax=Epithele typhae TaxID=378194 RepID=UPI00200816C3|nr:uncharacterized protein BXZ73DRAFT_101358 [Epithele typhae]KAH9932822.1 hypothetical protein BXZ73DRAFT_101358 [Epithele typhae]